MKSFINVSDHIENLASGRMLEVGEEFQLSNDEQRDAHNAKLISLGAITPVNPDTKEVLPLDEEDSGKKSKANKEGVEA